MLHVSICHDQSGRERRQIEAAVPIEVSRGERSRRETLEEWKRDTEARPEVPLLLRAGADEHDGDGAGDDLEIEPEGPVIDVFEVEPDPVAEVADVVATADLP